MPELPEVEAAARRFARAARGKPLARLRVLHPSLRKRIPAARAARVRGRRIARVERRGKHQLLILDDGAVIHVHFRMAGDWTVVRRGAADPAHARAVFEFNDGTRIALVDPRALSTLSYHADASAVLPALGMEADDPSLTPAVLARALGAKRSAIKPALLDQRVIAGVGNIYAAESLWRARIDPRAPAASLTTRRLTTLITAIRASLAGQTGAGRYADGDTARFHVYGRAGEPCHRCGAAIERLTQAGRSTCFCPRCQSR